MRKYSRARPSVGCLAIKVQGLQFCSASSFGCKTVSEVSQNTPTQEKRHLKLSTWKSMSLSALKWAYLLVTVRVKCNEPTRDWIPTLLEGRRVGASPQVQKGAEGLLLRVHREISGPKRGGELLVYRESPSPNKPRKQRAPFWTLFLTPEIKTPYNWKILSI